MIPTGTCDNAAQARIDEADARRHEKESSVGGRIRLKLYLTVELTAEQEATINRLAQREGVEDWKIAERLVLRGLDLMAGETT